MPTSVNNPKQKYAVVGNPIAHSRSPQIHQAFAEQCGIHLTYDKIEVAQDGFAEFASVFAQTGGLGINVTVPFKVDAYHYVDSLDEFAAAAGAVNTVKWSPSGEARGYNTDGIGLLNDLSQRHQISLAGKHIVLLGAGGASQGVLRPLLQAKPAALTIANRTLDKAAKLIEAERPNYPATQLNACSFTDLESADVVINGTSMGLQGEHPNMAPIVVRGAFCYDMSYGGNAHFLRWAQAQHAAESVDGLGMLVEQAARSFFIWHDVAPNTEAVYALLRAELDKSVA